MAWQPISVLVSCVYVTFFLPYPVDIAAEISPLAAFAIFKAVVKHVSAVEAKSVPDFFTAWPIKFLSESRMATFVLDAPTSTPTKMSFEDMFLSLIRFNCAPFFPIAL